MAAVTLDGPGREGESMINAMRAALWLGVSQTTFLRMIGRKPGKGPTAGRFAWVRSRKDGKEVLYPAEDVAIIRHVLLAEGAVVEDEDDEETQK
jgi:hypothetical protein